MHLFWKKKTQNFSLFFAKFRKHFFVCVNHFWCYAWFFWSNVQTSISKWAYRLIFDICEFFSKQLFFVFIFFLFFIANVKFDKFECIIISHYLFRDICNNIFKQKFIIDDFFNKKILNKFFSRIWKIHRNRLLKFNFNYQNENALSKYITFEFLKHDWFNEN